MMKRCGAVGWRNREATVLASEGESFAFVAGGNIVPAGPDCAAQQILTSNKKKISSLFICMNIPKIGRRRE
jgi:hypothetical protein